MRWCDTKDVIAYVLRCEVFQLSAGQRFGMRGRLWALWSLMAGEGVFCIAMGIANKSLPATILLMVLRRRMHACNACMRCIAITTIATNHDRLSDV
jgi:hypothetical protein